MITSNHQKLLKYLRISKKAFLLITFLFTLIAGAQTIALQVIATSETCAGNGTLTFSINGSPQQGIVNYKIYKLPNVNIPVYDGPAGTLSGQQAGIYKVVATQTINGTSQTDETTAEIENKVVFFSFTALATDALCGNDGIISVNTTTGTAVTYEIISGPVTTPPQASNIFRGLPPGFYIIKATDNCGSAPVVSLNVFSKAPVLNIGPAQFPDTELPDCTHITVRNAVTHLTTPVIAYPLTATFTVYPPGGAPPQYFTQTITTGGNDYQLIEQEIPFYYDTPYYYDLVVTDPCGNNYSQLQNLIKEKLYAFLSFDDVGCNKAAILSLDKFVPPYNTSFTRVPVGFIPSSVNPAYPGPFTDALTIFGDDQNGVPNGVYEITVTDACGNSATARKELLPDPDPIANGSASNNDCINNLGTIAVKIAPREIQTIKLTSAPQAYIAMYSAVLPQDVSTYATPAEGLKLDNLPPGTYTFDVYDACGFHYTPPTTVVVPDFTFPSIVVLQRQDCAPGLGTIMLTKDLTAASITAAPAAYNQSLPQNITNLISTDGDIYLEGIPPGNYTFSLTNPCEGTVTKSINIVGNEISRNDFTYTPFCGSFDLGMYHTGTPTASLKFWLQREYGAGTGIWGHPDGTMQYDGTLLNATNSVSVTNNTMTYSLMYPTGHYRVLKTYRAFTPAATDGIKDCTETIYDFSYYNDLKILNAELLNCGGSTANIRINTEGVSPMTYTITHKNGVAFTLNNGNNNTFTGLDPATYTVRIKDPCGHDETLIFNVSNLPPPVNAYPAPDITICDAGNDLVESYDLSQQDNSIRGSQTAANVSVTYHYSIADAVQGINQTGTNITVSGITTIYARATLISTPACYAISAFKVIPLRMPELTLSDNQHGCEGQPNAITANAGYIRYEWSTGETTQSIYPEHTGNYTVTVTNSNLCTATKTITLTTTAAALIKDVAITDWTDRNNTITIIAATTGGSEEHIEYSLDNVLWQDSNIFTGLPSAKYTVYARDKLGCGSSPPFYTYLLTYPKYFTPNGDNINETWRIEFSKLAEPGLMVYIYDRFGKLIIGFDTNNKGWDGTLNGTPLPSTDYWFVVRRQDGKEYRGHFALIR